MQVLGCGLPRHRGGPLPPSSVKTQILPSATTSPPRTNPPPRQLGLPEPPVPTRPPLPAPSRAFLPSDITRPTSKMATKDTFTIRTPCSSANIGPGFDVIGLALSIYLELTVTIDRSAAPSSHPLNCRLTYEGQGEGSADISLDPSSNLITRVALYVLRCHGQRAFPAETHVHINNPIPLGRGLGSSGAAVVAGVMLGKEVGGLHHLDKDRLFDYCLMIGMSSPLPVPAPPPTPCPPLSSAASNANLPSPQSDTPTTSAPPSSAASSAPTSSL